MIDLDNKTYFAAFKSKDSRFDGLFFVGIKTTGIYCRPLCRARMPKEENCSFFQTAAEAEKAGYRPCLRCRPELAPTLTGTTSYNALARKAVRMLEENSGNGMKLKKIAAKLGCTDRHLRRVFMEEFHVTPVEFLQTFRLLNAKNLLTDTDLSVIDVAMASGFGSLRRFNEVFQKHYHLTPTSLRKSTKEGSQKQGEITIGVGYQQPLLWEQLLSFFSLRAIYGVEVIRDGFYYRTVRQTDREGKTLLGWIKVGNVPEKKIVSVTISESLITVLSQILARIRQLFDLYCDPEVVYDALASMDDIKEGLRVKGTRIPGCMDPFEMSVRAVLGQQISVKAAGTIAGRIAEKFGTQIDTAIDGLKYVFPSAEDILSLEGKIEDHLGPLGIIATRARTILSLAQAFSYGHIDCTSSGNPEKEIKKLLQLPGIGSWTANYIAMRAMGWTDSFLETDYGIKKALTPMTQKEMLLCAQAWSPWRSYATINLWNSL